MPNQHCLICASDEGVFLDITEDEGRSFAGIFETCLSVKIYERTSLSNKICHKCAYELIQCNVFVNKYKESREVQSKLKRNCCILCLEPTKKGQSFDITKDKHSLNGPIQKIHQLFQEDVEKNSQDHLLMCLTCRYTLDILVDLKKVFKETVSKLEGVVEKELNNISFNKIKTSVVSRKTTSTESTRIRLSTPSDSESDTSTMALSKRREKASTDNEKSKEKDRQCERCHDLVKVGSDMYRLHRTKETVCKACWSTMDLADRKSTKRTRRDSETKLCTVFLKDVLKDSTSKNEKLYKIEKDEKGNPVCVISDSSSEDGASLESPTSSKAEMEVRKPVKRKYNRKYLKKENPVDESRHEETVNRDKLGEEKEKEEAELESNKDSETNYRKTRLSYKKKLNSEEEKKVNAKQKKLNKKEKLTAKEEKESPEESKSNKRENRSSAEEEKLSSEETPTKKRKVATKELNRSNESNQSNQSDETPNQNNDQGSGGITPRGRKKLGLTHSDSEAALPKSKINLQLKKKASTSDSSESSKDNRKKTEIESPEENVRITRNSKLTNSPKQKKLGKRKINLSKEERGSEIPPSDPSSPSLQTSFKSPLRKKPKAILESDDVDPKADVSEESRSDLTKDTIHKDSHKEETDKTDKVGFSCSECGVLFDNKLEGLSHQLNHFRQVELQLHRVKVPDKNAEKISEKIRSEDELISGRESPSSNIDSGNKGESIFEKSLASKDEEEESTNKDENCQESTVHEDNGKVKEGTKSEDEIISQRKSPSDHPITSSDNGDTTTNKDENNENNKENERAQESSLENKGEKEEEDKENAKTTKLVLEEEGERENGFLADQNAEEERIEDFSLSEEKEESNKSSLEKEESNKSSLEKEESNKSSLTQEEREEEKEKTRDMNGTEENKEEEKVEKSLSAQEEKEKEKEEEDIDSSERKRSDSPTIISKEVSKVQQKETAGSADEENSEGKDRNKEREEKEEEEQNEMEDESSLKEIFLDDDPEEKEVDNDMDVKIVDSGNSEHNVKSTGTNPARELDTENEVQISEDEEEEEEKENKSKEKHNDDDGGKEKEEKKNEKCSETKENDPEITEEIININDTETIDGPATSENKASKSEDNEIQCESEDLILPENSNDSHGSNALNPEPEVIKEVFDLAKAELRNRQHSNDLDPEELDDTDSETLENISREIHNHNII